MNEATRLSIAFAVFASLAAAAVGCSGASGNDPVDPLPENTGAIVAKLTNVPNDVQCVEIRTSDYRTPDVRVDVTPGGSATIRVAPLSPGYVELYGDAYNHPCSTWYGGGPDGGADDATWEATPTYVQVVPGQVAQADLHFHQFGGLDVNVDFDNCDTSGSFDSCDGGAADAGPDVWFPPVSDAGPIIVSGDAGPGH